jgi:signal transduction histidine kinase
MRLSTTWSYQLIYYLTAGLLFSAALLRSLLVYRGDPAFGQVEGLLFAWFLLFLTERVITHRWSVFFHLYLVIQTVLTLVLLFSPGFPDYVSVLFAILSMQIMQHFNPRLGIVFIGMFTPLMMIPLARSLGISLGIAFGVVYTALNALLAAFALTTKRAYEARAHNLTLTQELERSNQQLQAYSEELERLAVARERHHLARELHDSVTQTVFSMTLVTRASLMLLEKEPYQLKIQLDRLNQLASGALSEMRVLIAELHPVNAGRYGLAASLKRHIEEGFLPDDLTVALEVEGNGLLEPAEEQGLFRIAQESLNNIVKHAQTSQAWIRLHLQEPFWMEIEDRGRGFDLYHARDSSTVGLASMSERAVNIGWELKVTSSPGEGTTIRVQKKPNEERLT